MSSGGGSPDSGTTDEQLFPVAEGLFAVGCRRPSEDSAETRVLRLVRALRALGATRVQTGDLLVEFAPLEPEPEHRPPPQPLSSRERQRLADLEAEHARLAELPGWVGA